MQQRKVVLPQMSFNVKYLKVHPGQRSDYCVWTAVHAVYKLFLCWAWRTVAATPKLVWFTQAGNHQSLCSLWSNKHTQPHTHKHTEMQRSRWMFGGRQRERFSTWGILYNGSVVILHHTHAHTHTLRTHQEAHTNYIDVNIHTHTRMTRCVDSAGWWMKQYFSLNQQPTTDGGIEVPIYYTNTHTHTLITYLLHLHKMSEPICESATGSAAHKNYLSYYTHRCKCM